MRGQRSEDFQAEISGGQDVRAQLVRLQSLIEDLRVQYEQYFVGVIPHAPEKLHKETKRLIRELMKAPFKNSETRHRLKGLERRYQSYNTYWERVKKQREEGTYQRDRFKASLRERHAIEDAQAGTREGSTKQGMQDLFRSYQKALEKNAGKAMDLDYSKFKRQMVKRAQELKKQTGAKKLSFKVVVKNGRVSLKATTK